MKKIIVAALAVLMAFSVSACSSSDKNTSSSSSSSMSSSGMSSTISSTVEELNPMDTTKRTCPDGTYRGAFIDPKQVEISFDVKDNKFTKIEFKALGYKGEDYLNSKDPKMKAIAEQYKQLADYLIGKQVHDLDALYNPEKIAKDVEGSTSATLKGNKMISAINDGLNRGVYEKPNHKIESSSSSSSSSTSSSMSSSGTTSSSSSSSSSSSK
ncbi:MAG: hypothetical protein RR806_00285 [Oscillospiraceae bacterium]